jgi:hypothetical protein
VTKPVTINRKGNNYMPGLPKLKVIRSAWSDQPEEIQSFEQAKDFPYHEELVIVAEGRQINSYEDLVLLAQQERYGKQEYIEVIFLPMIVGG